MPTSQILNTRTMQTSRAQSLTFAAMAAEHLERMGARMRERREQLNLSRDEMARRMVGKTNGNSIYRWERGEIKPREDTLEEIAKVLDVAVSYFYTDEPAPGTADLLGALSKDDAEARLIRIERLLQENNAMLVSLLGDDPAATVEAELADAAAETSRTPKRGSAANGRARRSAAH